MKILITGSDGQLGSEIKKISSMYDFSFEFSNREKFDFSNLNSINFYLDRINPDIIINCFGFTNVDKAENNYELANILNYQAVKIVAKWTNKNHCRLIHISTDFVFDGKKKYPLNENSNTSPINNYGKTKLLGENACIINNPNSIIFRTSWLYSSFGENFVTKIIALMKQTKNINVVDDQFGSPTYAADLSEAIMDIIKNNIWQSGIYNFSNSGIVSRYEFANDIKEIYGFKSKINPLKSKEYPSFTIRPEYSVLDNTKFIKTFKIKIKPYKDSLNKCINILKNG